MLIRGASDMCIIYCDVNLNQLPSVWEYRFLPLMLSYLLHMHHIWFPACYTLFWCHWELCHLFLLAPSGPPQSFRAVAISSTSIRLTWRAPLQEEQNGVITSFRITITDVGVTIIEGTGGVVIERSAQASSTLLVVDSLSPHSSYRCTIAAFTIAIGPILANCPWLCRTVLQFNTLSCMNFENPAFSPLLC